MLKAVKSVSDTGILEKENKSEFSQQEKGEEKVKSVTSMQGLGLIL